MAYSEHIYMPDGNSLEARISAYKTVHEAWFNAEASLNFWMMIFGLTGLATEIILRKFIRSALVA